MINEENGDRNNKKKISEMAKAVRIPEDIFRRLITSDANSIDYKDALNEYESKQKAARAEKSRQENKTGTLEDLGGGIEYI